MKNDQIIEVLIERLVQRVDKANETILRNMGEMIKELRELTPTQAHKLVQMLKYGSNYDKIVNEISKYTDMNAKDINEIFADYATKDQSFYEQFYQYKNIPFIPYEKNYALKTQTMALAKITQKELLKYSSAKILGYSLRDAKGNIVFKGLKETYDELLDTALLNVGQGKETFDSAISNIMKQIGESGLKTIDYESGRSVRLDSTVKMHLQEKLRDLHNENQEIFGKEFDADGVEISVHVNPAPDHERVQGKQFSKKEYAKLQAGLYAKDYKGNMYTLDHDGKNGYRPISQLNCYHYVFDIVLGASKPEYTDKQLKEIRDKNSAGFQYYDKRLGKYKKMTLYEGTQLQRNIERKIREQKDIQILAKESNNKNLILESQNNITALTKQYKELSEISGLPTKMDRLKVAGYKRTKTNKGD